MPSSAQSKMDSSILDSLYEEVFQVFEEYEISKMHVQ